MFKLIALAVAVTVAGPTYSGAVEEREVAQLARQGQGSERERERQALSVLIQRHWVEGEAVERGIVVTPQEVDDAYEEQVEAEFDSRKAFRAYLRRTGRTETALKASIRSDLLTGALRQQIAEPAAKSVTPDQVKAHVDANPQLLPATRTVRVVRTSSRRAAMAVLRKLRRGATWSSVGGSQTTVDRSNAGTAAERAMLRARVKTLTRYGRVVFRVTRDTPERPMPRAQQEAIAWERLASEAQQAALDAFLPAFTAKWRQRTACAAQYAGHADCGQPPMGQPAP